MSTAYSIAASASLLLGMTLFLLVGRRLGAKGRDAAPGASAVQAATAGLVALLLAFTVASAGQRFDARRLLIVDETNAIGTAYLRLDLLPAESRQGLRERFRAYLDSRIATYRLIPDLAAVTAELEHSQAIQRAIWADAVAAVRAQPQLPATGILLLPSLNAMIDISTTRSMVTRLHPPAAIFVMLVLALLASALYTGYAMAGGRRTSWMHAIGFLLLSAVVFATILDLEFPRAGFLRETAFDQALIDLRRTMQ